MSTGLPDPPSQRRQIRQTDHDSIQGLARDLITYPETVTLARTLATLPNRPHRDTGKALNLIAHRLNLARLTPKANDPLYVFLTHTRH
ncbi:hypothetical protein [Streptomyces sp. NPDC059816]|uniref:hypothetical protein n=1 Tax=Streptomyces sp. NPDC059816 TaxID=3346960 RepID=UPI00364D3500